ncbi:MAG: hypothetical protein HOI95_07145 [Chromatiales bacterium]|jgi:hypothetical protein|nr:hypothetical protein [Chromatiales bacterium]
MRKVYGTALVALNRSGETFREGDGVRRMPFAPGDTLIVHTTWDALSRLRGNRNYEAISWKTIFVNIRPRPATG